jgi:hypothetical protein
MSLQLDPHAMETPPPSVQQSLQMIYPGEPPPHWRPPKPGFLQTLWRKVAPVVGTIVGLMLAVSLWQHLAPDGWRISQLVGHFSGDVQSAQIAASLDAEVAKNAALLEELARKEKAVIDAQARAQELVAAAQSQAQQEIMAMQGRMQVMTTAYQTLFDRANQLAIAYANTTQAYIQTRNEMMRGNQGGSVMVATVADMFKGLALVTGDQQMYDKAENAKRTMTESQMRDMDATMSRALPNLDARAFLAQGLPDPAQLAMQMSMAPQVYRPARIEIGTRPARPVNPYPPSAPKH